MKIECVKDKLAEAVSKAEKITGKNLTLPVMGCILFEAKGRELILRSTNLDLGIEIIVPVKVISEGKVAVPGNIINSFISSIVGGKNVILEVVDNNLKVTTDTNTTVIKSMNSDDFPTIPTLQHEKKFNISPKDLIKGIKSVWYSSATSSMKPELSSVYVYSDSDSDTLVFVATDSFRLAEKRVKIKNGRDIGSILLPVKNIPEIMRVLEGVSGDVEVSLNKNQISFKYDGVYLTSRVIDGIFPDYKQIIPKDYKTSITILKQDLINAFKTATIFSDKFNKISVACTPNDKKFTLTTKNADIGENTNTLEVVAEGDEIQINFNYRYIMECFQSIEADSVSLQFHGLTKPLVINGINDKSFQYIVMPINK